MNMEKMKCDWYSMSREQREAELKRGMSLKWTEGYESMGCYKCDGYNEDCEVYRDLVTLKKAGGKA